MLQQIDDTLIGHDVVGNPHIAGIFRLSEWGVPNTEIYNMRLTGRLWVPSNKDGIYRSRKIGVGLRYSEQYARTMWERQQQLLYDMKLAIKREAYLSLCPATTNEEHMAGHIVCGLIFQYPVVRNFPPAGPQDIETRIEVEYVTAACVDDPGSGFLAMPSEVVLPDDEIFIPEKDIDLIVRDSLTPPDPYPGRA